MQRTVAIVSDEMQGNFIGNYEAIDPTRIKNVGLRFRMWQNVMIIWRDN